MSAGIEVDADQLPVSAVVGSDAEDGLVAVMFVVALDRRCGGLRFEMTSRP